MSRSYDGGDVKDSDETPRDELLAELAELHDEHVHPAGRELTSPDPDLATAKEELEKALERIEEIDSE